MKMLRILKRKDESGVIVIEQDPRESTETILTKNGMRAEDFSWRDVDILDLHTENPNPGIQIVRYPR